MVKRVLAIWSGFSLIKRIVAGLLIGVILGLVFPQAAVVGILGTLFVSILKALAPVLVFFLVIRALANAKASGSMKVVILLYVISTIVAALVVAVFSTLFPVSITLAEAVAQDSPSGIGEVLQSLLLNVVANPIDALAKANYLGILAWAALIGIALRVASERTKTVVTDISNAVSKMVHWAIELAPFGVLGLVFTTVSTSGLGIFTEYGQLLLLLVGSMLVIALVTNPLIVFLCLRRNPYRLVFRCLKDSGITAFFTRSSAANIPVNLTLCGKLGLHRDAYSV
ncbi:MAG: serine/threonine transporter SstT, partial [Coriobacteriales bacterium]|nr:serine/threonine transporter SstT [Coriobacteriales bacterium]